jgi:DNA-binding NarL/FixJ family response regulator
MGGDFFMHREAHGRTSVVLVDRDVAYRHDLGDAINAHPLLRLEAEFDNPNTAYELIIRTHPPVVVLDPRTGDGSGWRLIERLRARAPHVSTLLCTAVADCRSARRVGQALGHTVISKREGLAGVCNEILTAALDLAEGGHAEPSPSDAPTSLTDREYEILRLMSEGKLVPDIARTLYRSESTVKKHRTTIFEKLGVHDRAAAVHAAHVLGLL